MLSSKQQKSVDEKRSKITAAYARLGTAEAVAKELHIPSSSVRRLMNGQKHKPDFRETHKRIGLTAVEILNQYDKSTYIPKRVREGLQKLGAKSALHDVDFAKLCSVSLIDLGHVRDEFAEYWAVARGGKRLWFGSVEFAAAMRERIT